MENYEIVRAIGQGNFGTAHLAICKSDNRKYCIKMIPVGDEKAGEAALREAETLAKMRHPNVISYKECFLHDNRLNIVTQFCEEGDLFHKIQEASKKGVTFDPKLVLNWFTQILMGLHHVHSNKVLHRDLKTQNIFIGKGGIIKIGDFGISKVLDNTNDFATTVTGTPYYMSPECCQNQKYTFKSDIWSLGCILYELCTLKHAFDAENLLSLVYQIVAGTFPPVPAQYQQFESLVRVMLARDANQRPTATQLLNGIPFVKEEADSFYSKISELEKTYRTMEAPLASPMRASRVGPTGSPVPLGGASPADGRPARPRSGVRTNRVPGMYTQAELQSMTPKQRVEANKAMERAQKEAELYSAALISRAQRKEAKERKQRDLQGNLSGGGRAGGSPFSGGRGGPSTLGAEDMVNLGTMSPSSQSPARPATSAVAYYSESTQNDYIDVRGTGGGGPVESWENPNYGGGMYGNMPAGRGTSRFRAERDYEQEQEYGRHLPRDDEEEMQGDSAFVGKGAGGGRPGSGAPRVNAWDDVPVKPRQMSLEEAIRAAMPEGEDAGYSLQAAEGKPSRGGVPVTVSGAGAAREKARRVSASGPREEAEKAPAAGSALSESTQRQRKTWQLPEQNAPLQIKQQPPSPPLGPRGDDSDEDDMVNLGTMNVDIDRGVVAAVTGAAKKAAGQGALGSGGPPAPGSPGFTVVQAAHSDEDADEVEDEFDEDYEDDFEEEEEEESQAVLEDLNATINSQLKKLHLSRLQKASGGAASGNDTPLEDSTPVHTQDQKKEGLREVAIRKLGKETFNKVYSFLHGLRISKAGASITDEELKAKLRALVKDPSMVPACVMVDRLVFTEMFSQS
eukprot:jgi/Mesvir1/27402/Mv07203-RA.4